MGIIGRILGLGAKRAVLDLPAGGRETQAPEETLDYFWSNALFGYRTAAEFMPFEVMDLLQQLSIIMPDMAQAVDNIARLGNTGHRVEIFGSERAADDLNAALDDLAQRIYPHGCGMDGFVNDVLSQIARSGALSVEWVARRDLSGWEKIVLVPVRTIRFILRDGEYIAVQTKSGHEALKDQFIELNPLTYLYYAIERLDTSFYAVPPMLSALDNVMVQRDIMKQLKFVARKLGIMGFLEVLLSAPEQKPGETVEAFKERCRTYLRETAERVKGSFKDGLVLGFKEVQEFKMNQVVSDARGVKDLVQMNEEQVCSGIKQDPAMMGRTYSTTETYAGVVFSKLVNQIQNYQRLVRRCLEHGYALEARMLGIAVDKISVKFNESDLVNRRVKAEAEEIEIRNANSLYDAGVIDQAQRAQRLGFAAPALPAGRLELTMRERSSFADSGSLSARRPAAVLEYNSRSGAYERVERSGE